MANLKITVVPTTPIDGQAPGTSGLRKPTKTFMGEHYTENFVQCILSGMGEKVRGSTLVVGGDGRFFVKEATVKIVQMCAANKVAKLLIGQHGIMSTPAVSCVIRKYGTTGGIILTASHNPGGPDKDFGIKFNMENGGPAPQSETDRVYDLTTKIYQYNICNELVIDIDKIGSQKFSVEPCGDITVEIIDSVQDYLEMCKEIFDFGAIRNLISGGSGSPKIEVMANGLNGVTGPYIKRIFIEELGVYENNAVGCEPLPDFGGHHPDPNLTYGYMLVDEMKKGMHDIGFAFDGDGDRNMILGKNAFFISPCDSLAVIAAYLDVIPYFRRTGVKGYARSMPTSGALDRVAHGKHKELFVTPTGWKFFGNLMDAGRLSLCGEESFGTGSDHIREKDGLWAALAWLSIMASKGKLFSSVEQIMKDHWGKFGRNFFTRYDYENVDSAGANEMVALLNNFIADKTNIGKIFSRGSKHFKVAKTEDFEYVDPIDHSVAKKQGIIITFEDGSRIIFRLSGTGSSGATVRMYIDSYEADSSKILLDSQEMLMPLIEIALQISQLREFTGRSEPNVIT